MTNRPPLLRRWLLLTLGGGVGAACFVPAILASSPDAGWVDLAPFVVGVTVVDAVCAWLGLRWADRASLPMPYLRAFESGTPATGAEPGRAARDTLASALTIAVATIAVLRWFELPNLDAPLPARLLSTGFAAVSLEIVVHLAVMSGIARATGRLWLAIAASTVVFVAFHGSGVIGMPAPVVLASLTLNGLFGLAMGGLYARHGFEWVVIGHAVAHALAVGVG